MKIVQVVNSLDVGGLERMVVDLAREFQREGHETLIYCIFHVGTLGADAAASGIRVVDFAKRPGLSLTSLMQLRRRLGQDRPDVVLTHNSGIHHYAAVAARLAQVPVIVNTRHNPLANAAGSSADRYYRVVAPLTDAMVFVSDDARRTTLARLGLSGAKAHVIINGIPVERYQRVAASPASKRPAIRFGTIGRLVPVKAHDVLLQAFCKVLHTMPEATLRITGDGPLKEGLERQVRELGIAHAVRFDGRVPDPENVFRELDVFVLSSHSEGLPLALLEAMAAGLPIVSTEVGGIPEVLARGDFSFVCPPADPARLADAMLRAAQSPRLAAMGAAAMACAVRDYSLERMTRQYVDLFQSVSRSCA